MQRRTHEATRTKALRIHGRTARVSMRRLTAGVIGAIVLVGIGYLARASDGPGSVGSP